MEKRSIIGYGSPHLSSREMKRKIKAVDRERQDEHDEALSLVPLTDRAVYSQDGELKGIVNPIATHMLADNLCKWDQRLPWETFLGRLALIEKMKKKYKHCGIDIHTTESGELVITPHRSTRNKSTR